MHTTDSKHALLMPLSVLNRQLNPTQLNQVWVADITHLRMRSGWLYLAGVPDLFARKVVGWCAGLCNWPSCSVDQRRG